MAPASCCFPPAWASISGRCQEPANPKARPGAPHRRLAGVCACLDNMLNTFLCAQELGLAASLHPFSGCSIVRCQLPLTAAGASREIKFPLKWLLARNKKFLFWISRHSLARWQDGSGFRFCVAMNYAKGLLAGVRLPLPVGYQKLLTH